MKTWTEQKQHERTLHHTGRPESRRVWLEQFRPRFDSAISAAAWAGMPVNSLHRMAKNHGVLLPCGKSGFQTWIPIDEIRRLAGEGFVACEIADKVGCSLHQVRHLSAVHEITITYERDAGRTIKKPARKPATPVVRPFRSPMWDKAVKENARMRRVGRV